jgi:hypothetical protein
MSLAAFYLHKVDQCARLTEDAAPPGQRCRFESERRFWLQIMDEKLQVDEEALEAASRCCRWNEAKWGGYGSGKSVRNQNSL